MVYGVYIALVAVAFLINLNDFLRGAKKAQIDAVLILLLLGLIIIAFVFAGWKLGLLAVAVAYLSTVMTRSAAARLASRLLASVTGRGGRYVGLPPRPLEIISHRLSRSTLAHPDYLRQLLSGTDPHAGAEEALLDYCESQPAIRAVMREFQVSRNTLRELYHQLVAAGAGQWACGHWVAASALA
jgi:ribosomal protein S14